MDYVLHINDGVEEAKPIVLRLLPGEEIILNLKIVNHGDPSNVSLEVSDTLLRAFHLKKSNYYVVLEEIVPIMAKMPESVDRLDGKLLVTGYGRSSSVPISLARGSEDPGDDLEDDVSVGVDEDLSDWNGEEDAEETDENGVLVEEKNASEDEANRIDFSRDRDLQSYRSASRRNMPGSIGATSYNEGNGEASPYGGPGGYESSEYASEDAKEADEDSTNDREDVRSNLFSMIHRDRIAMLIVPAVMLVSLIFVLILTFYMGSIPELLGALASSILIVTLIIYGAATLLKA